MYFQTRSESDVASRSDSGIIVNMIKKYSTRTLHILNGSQHFIAIKRRKIRQQFQLEAHQKQLSKVDKIFKDSDIRAQ